MIESLLETARDADARADVPSAVALYEQVLQIAPDHGRALTRLGALYAATGRHADSIRAFAAVAEMRPDSAGAHYNLGRVLLVAGHRDQAYAAFAAAVRRGPGYSPAYLAWADGLQRAGRWDEAIAVYELAARSGCADPLLSLNHGASLAHLRRHEEALPRFADAVRRRAALAEAHFASGTSLAALGRHAEAAAALSRALEQRPSYPEARVNRGNALAALGRYEEALADYDEALSTGPATSTAHRAAGVSHRALGQMDKAIAHLLKALELDSRSAETWEILGDTYTAVRVYERAHECLRLASGILQAEQAPAGALGVLLYKRLQAFLLADEYREALACADELARLDPDFPYAAGHRLLATAWTASRDRLEPVRTEVLRRAAAGEPVSVPFPLLAVTDSAATQLACARAFVARTCPSPATPLARPGGYGHERIRIAYVSPDFTEHPVGHLIAATIERHDRARFEVVGLSTLVSPPSSPTRERLRAAFDEFAEVSALSDRAIAELMRSREIDIAVDLATHTAGGRPGIFAYRPAPVQVNFLGYPGTSGASFMNYIVSDAYVIPKGSEDCYSERIARMPATFIPPGDVRARRPRPDTRAEHGLPDEAVVLGAFHNTYKIMPEVFAVWVRLLASHANAVLWIAGHEGEARAEFRNVAEAGGARPEQLLFAPRVPDHGAHLARLGLVDLLLDTYPYNAHSSAADALWAGVPVLTCAGRSFASRVAGGLLHALGLPELVTESLETYEDVARRLCADPPQLARLKARVRAAVADSGVFDPVRYTRELEAVYARMWALESRGCGAQSFMSAAADAGDARPGPSRG